MKNIKESAQQFIDKTVTNVKAGISNEKNEKNKKKQMENEGIQFLYSGFPIIEVLSGVGAISGFVTFLKSIKRVPPGFEGRRITLERVSDKASPNGIKITDPTRWFQKMALVDRRPVATSFEGAGNGLLRDGTPFTGDIVATLEFLNGKDALEYVELAPVVSLAGTKDDNGNLRRSFRIQEFLEKIVDPAVDYAATEAAGNIPNFSTLTDPRSIQFLERTITRRSQQSIDEKLFSAKEPALLEELNALDQNERLKVKRGIGVTGISIKSFAVNPEIVQAYTELNGAEARAQGEKTMQKTLGKNYGTYTKARAAREAAETGSTTVVHLGGGSKDDESAAVLDKMSRRPRRNPSADTNKKISEVENKVRQLESRFN